jgi:cytochrome oxidase assembly protein ShyY1
VSWRFALSPKWIARHIAVLLLVAGMLSLLAWQLDRRDEKRDYKELVEGREAMPAQPVEGLLAPGLHDGDPQVAAVLYRNATAEGTYVADRTVVVENRTSSDDSPGGWVLTPLVLHDGRSVLVNRGFVGYDADGEIVAPPPPSGVVRVTGLLFPSQHRGSFGAADVAGGVLKVVKRVDLDRIDQQVDGDLLPAYLQLARSDPGEPPVRKGAAAVEALGPPEVSEGPHLSYAVQWGIFSTIATVGYGLLLRKVAREEEQRRRAGVV